jgi:hypothetical protein
MTMLKEGTAPVGVAFVSFMQSFLPGTFVHPEIRRKGQA